MLDIEGLSYRYSGADKPALDEFSLHVERGSVLGLLGPNGAGKTTLLAHLVGLLSLQHGSITLEGRPLPEVRRHAPTRIALAPQEYAFYPMLTVAENLACFAGACRLQKAEARRRIDECIAFAQLERFAATRADQLSGGLKRRLNLAIALLPEPELLLLDEPTVGVDPQSRAFLLDRVKDLAQQGCTILYTSHYMDEIEAIADRVAIIDHGRLLRHGPLATLLAESGTTLHVRADALPMTQQLDLLSAFGETSQRGEAVAVKLSNATSASSALIALEAAGGSIRSANYGGHNLEDLFMQLTHRSLRD